MTTFALCIQPASQWYFPLASHYTSSRLILSLPVSNLIATPRQRNNTSLYSLCCSWDDSRVCSTVERRATTTYWRFSGEAIQPKSTQHMCFILLCISPSPLPHFSIIHPFLLPSPTSPCFLFFSLLVMFVLFFVSFFDPRARCTIRRMILSSEDTCDAHLRYTNQFITFNFYSQHHSIHIQTDNTSKLIYSFKCNVLSLRTTSLTWRIFLALPVVINPSQRDYAPSCSFRYLSLNPFFPPSYNTPHPSLLFPSALFFILLNLTKDQASSDDSFAWTASSSLANYRHQNHDRQQIECECDQEGEFCGSVQRVIPRNIGKGHHPNLPLCRSYSPPQSLTKSSAPHYIPSLNSGLVLFPVMPTTLSPITAIVIFLLRWSTTLNIRFVSRTVS